MLVVRMTASPGQVDGKRKSSLIYLLITIDLNAADIEARQTNPVVVFWR
jgi:hypothetical protein